MKEISENLLRTFYNKWHVEISKKKSRISLKNPFLDFLCVKPGTLLLDVACGKGEFLYSCIVNRLKAFGIDLSEEALLQAKNNLNSLNLICGNAESLPFKDEIFDYVTCLGSLEHFLNPEKAIREISRVLKENGKVLLLLPNLYFAGHIYITLRYGTEPDEGEQQFSEIFKTKIGWKELIERIC